MTKTKYTKQELAKLRRGHIWNLQIAWNYERMQGLGYLTSILPVLERSYGDNPELMAKALRTHNQFYNTHPGVSNIIFGMNVALEEESAGKDVIDTSAALKTALMGPFAGIGDTLFGMIAGSIFGSIAVSFASMGSWIGLAVPVLWMLTYNLVIRPKMFDMGYTQGTALVGEMSETLNAFTNAASVLGITVVGSMIASMVNVTFGTLPVKGLEDGLDLQEAFFDKLMPKSGSVIIVALSYWLLDREWMNSNKLIIAIVLLCIISAFIGHKTDFNLFV